MKDLEWTGERLTTAIESDYGVIEHLHRYALAQKIINDKIVLDIASGEGYGSSLMGITAKKVYGIDIDKKSVTHAKNKYSNHHNVEFLIGSTDKIPLESNSVDVVVSFETIEHHDEHDLMMQEIKRVLKVDGILLISSPEKSIYSERDPYNPFHIKELTLEDFEVLLNKYFKYNYLMQQRFVIGSFIHLIDIDKESKFNLFDGNYKKIESKLNEYDFFNKPYFNMAICSNSDVNDYSKIGCSLFNGVEVVTKKIQNLQISKDEILNTNSYKLGNYILKRFKFVKKIWKK